MRILHVDAGRAMRGGQWQVLHLLEEQLRRGPEAELLCPAESPLFATTHGRGLPVRPLTFWALRQRSRACALTHAHDARSHTLAAFLARRPFVVSRRVAFGVGESLASRWKYGQAAHYLAVSRVVKRNLEAVDVPGEIISVVPDGVSAVPASAVAPVGSSRLVVAAATADPRKGSTLLREAAQRAQVPVLFSDDLRRDLPRAGLFVYITSMEGLGSAALLAMAHGVPVLASNVGGLPEIVRPGETGVLTENSAVKIAFHLTCLLDDPAQRARLGARGRALVDAEYSLDRLAERTDAVYREVLSA